MSMTIHDCIERDPDKMGGRLVFKGTRMPIEDFVNYIRAGYSYKEFLDEYETSVTMEQAAVVLSSILDVGFKWVDALVKKP